MANILNTTYSFQTEDIQAPYLRNQDPAPSQSNVPAGTNVTLEVVDDGSGVNAASVVITIDGTVCWQNDTQQPGFSVVKTVVSGGFRYVIDPDANFPEGSSPVVEVEADDFGATVNHLDTAYSFDIASAPPYLWNRNPGPGATNVSPTTNIELEILDTGSGVDPLSVVLKVQGVTCWQNNAQQGPFAVTKSTVPLGYRYVINPASILPDDSDVVVDVYAKDFTTPTPGVLDTYYSFHTGFAAIDAHVPLCACYVDHVVLSTDGTRPIVCNRVPAPPTPPASLVSQDAEPFYFEFSTTATPRLLLAGNGQLVLALTPSAHDVLTKAGHVVYLEAGGFLPGHAGKYLKISGSVRGNNRYHKISTYIDGHHVILDGTLVSDETGAFLNPDVPDGVWDLTLEPFLFYKSDFVDPTNATAAEVAAALTARSTVVRAKTTPSGEVVLVSLAGDLTVWDSADIPFRLSFTTATDRFYEAGALEDIKLTISDPGTAGVGRARVSVRTAGVTTQVYDSQGPIVAPGWSVARTVRQSPGASVDDVWDITLSHTTPFKSEELVKVDVIATTVDAVETTWSHLFLVEDYIKPSVVSIIPWTRKRLRVQYSEDMQTTRADSSSILYYRDISGRVAYHHHYTVGTEQLEVIEAPVAGFVQTDLGCFIGAYGARNAVNNNSFKITRILSSSLVAVDRMVVEETPADLLAGEDAPTLVLSNYRIVPVHPQGRIQPIFTPIVVSVELADPLTVAPGTSLQRFAQLELHDDLTPGANYQLEVANVEDSDGVVIGSLYPFTSWQPRSVPRRNFSLWDMIPQANKDEDETGDLEAFIKSLDELVQVLLADIDSFGDLLDPVTTKEEVLDVLLAHLGNPLLFAGGLTTQKKRDLVPILVPMYKRRGTSAGIEDATAFFTGKTVTVVPWVVPVSTWTLGVSLLGVNTFIGPSWSFVRYAFYIEHNDVLTAQEEDLIREIVEFVRPAHTHFIGFRLT